MDVQALLNSRQAGILGLWLSRLLPPSAGYRFTDWLAARLATKKQMPMARAVRCNQWVVSDCELSSQELDEAVLQVGRQITRSFYVLFHYFKRWKQMQEMMVFAPMIDRLIKMSQEATRGVMVCGLHLSNFDLLAQATYRKGLKAVAISLPQPSKAVEWQHRMRLEAGMPVWEGTTSTVRQAIERLQSGEIVVTGFDHPVDGITSTPLFFGHPANLPVHHVHMAMHAQVSIVLVACILQADGKYHTITSDFIEMEHMENRRKAVIFNAERVLEVAAGMIRQAPQQWVIFQPVWPQLLDQTPT